MKLRVIYEDNKSGQRLLEGIKIRQHEAVWEEFTLEEKPYLAVCLKNGKSLFQRTINHPDAIKRCSDRENFLSVIKLNQINAGLEDPEASKIYEVLIFDMKIIFIRQRVGMRGSQKIRYLRENQKSRVAEIAKRVILLSGLDLALIKIQLNSKKRLQVIGAEPSPDLRDKDVESLLEEIDRLSNCQAREVKLGADPEFMIINHRSGKLVSASNFFPVNGLVGCDNIRLPNRQQRPVAELRPKPEKSPLQLVSNLRYALIRANGMAADKNVKWVAGSQPVPGYSIGGHVHFSNVELNAALLRALDNYLGLMVFMIEKPHTACKRRKKYGLLGEYRVKNYGGFEYRTPGSWLVSQKITTAVLCLAKVVASNYLQLSNNYLNLAEAQQAFYSGNREYFMKDFENIWHDLERCRLYSKYEEELEILRFMISNDLQWDEKKDIRKGWNLSTSSRRNNSRAALQNSRQGESVYESVPAPATDSSTISTSRSGERRPVSGRSGRSRRSNGSGSRRSVSRVENVSRNTVIISHQALPAAVPASVPPSRAVGPVGVRRAIMV
jgi:hypothetical protein